MLKSTYLQIALFFASITPISAQIADSVQVKQLQEVTIIGTSPFKVVGSGAWISQAKIQQLNQPDINRAIQTIPGINVRDEEGFGLRPNIGLRGTPVNRSAKITLMEDGILMAPAPYSDPSAYYFPTFARMEQLEVLKGSSQVKYGPYTIGGALNLISTSIPDSFKGFVQLSYGSFGTNQQRIWVGDSQKNVDYLFEVNRLASNGFKELPSGANTGFDRRDFMGKIRWHSDVNNPINQSLTLKFVNMSEEGNESYLGLTYLDFVNNPNRRYAATQKDLLDMNHQHISLTHTISPNNRFSITSSAYAAKTFRDWSRVNTVGGVALNTILADPITNASAYSVMTGQTTGNVNFQSAERTFHVLGFQSNLSYRFETGSWRHHLQFGIRFHQDDADRYATQSTYLMSNATMILSSAGVKGNAENQIRKANSFASYVQYDLQLEKLTITPGVRYEAMELGYDNYGTTDNARLGTTLKTATNSVAILLPGLGVSYAFRENERVFGGVHRGFSPPGMPSLTSNAIQAKSETALSYELGYRKQTKHFKTQLVAFLNDYQNILGSDNVSGGGAGTGDMFNAGNAKIQGIEFSLEQNLWRSSQKWRVPLSISYTYNDAKFMQTFINAGGDWGTGTITSGELMPFITPHLLSLSVGVESEKMNITLVSRYVGNTRIKTGGTVDILPSATSKYAEVNTMGGYWVVDLSGNYTFSKSITFFSTINNLLNNAYIVANLPQGFRPGMPFSANIGVKINL
ncbi:MAG: Iron(III) dicitrate transport protein FecA [Bacteroidota bacterium]|jgi:Fe(3+) dicitrate transport protein